MDEHTLRVLEYPKITEMLAERAACSLGAERARELLPTNSFSLVAERSRRRARRAR
jgi:dsDNA-specific endonuclease/ATPase MutS2